MKIFFIFFYNFLLKNQLKKIEFLGAKSFSHNTKQLPLAKMSLSKMALPNMDLAKKALRIRTNSPLLDSGTLCVFLNVHMFLNIDNSNTKNLHELIRIRQNPQAPQFFSPEFYKGMKSPIIQEAAKKSVNICLLKETYKPELCVDEFIHHAFRCVFALEGLEIFCFEILDDLNLVDEDTSSKIKKCYLQVKMPSPPTNDDFLKEFEEYMHHIILIVQQIFQGMNITYLEKIANEADERAKTVEIVLREIEELLLQVFYHGNKATAFYYGTDKTSFNREMKKKYCVQ